MQPGAVWEIPERAKAYLLDLLQGGGVKLHVDYIDLLYRTRIIWGPVLPQDKGRLVRDEEVLVSAGIHSRRRAMDELGIEDPDAEFGRWLEEEERLPLTQRKTTGEGGQGV